MLPRVVIFDLDGTLWRPEMYELWHGGGAPFKAHSTRKDALVDRSGTTVELIGDAYGILQQLAFDPRWKENKTIIGISSTCDEPEWAKECLSKLFLDDRGTFPMGALFDGFTEIYSARKSEHFKRILKKVQQVDATVKDFSQFIFFDNQQNNIQDVGNLPGVTCVYCPNGMQPGVWEQGLREWEANQKKPRSSGSASY
jgi:magnesium-dependent phosphatase 1